MAADRLPGRSGRQGAAAGGCLDPGDPRATLPPRGPPGTRPAVGPLQETIALPVVEVPLRADACEAALRALRAAEQTQGGQVPFEITKALEDRRAGPGGEGPLPHLFSDTP